MLWSSRYPCQTMMWQLFWPAGQLKPLYREVRRSVLGWDMEHGCQVTKPLGLWTPEVSCFIQQATKYKHGDLYRFINWVVFCTNGDFCLSELFLLRCAFVSQKSETLLWFQRCGRQMFASTFRGHICLDDKCSGHILWVQKIWTKN